MLLCEVLTKMTRNFRRDRLDVNGCSGLVAILGDRFRKYKSAAEDSTPMNNEGPQFLKTSNSFILEEKDLKPALLEADWAGR